MSEPSATSHGTVTGKIKVMALELAEALIHAEMSNVDPTDVLRIMERKHWLIEEALHKAYTLSETRENVVEECQKYLRETLAGNHPHLAHAYRHAAENLGFLKTGPLPSLTNAAPQAGEFTQAGPATTATRKDGPAGAATHNSQECFGECPEHRAIEDRTPSAIEGKPDATYLRQLFDKTAGAFDGDYQAKVDYALMQVYAYGWRSRGMRPSLAEKRYPCPLQRQSLRDALDVAECSVHDQIKDPAEREYVQDGLQKLWKLANAALDRTASPLRRTAEWDGTLRIDSDCIINGEPIKAGTVLQWDGTGMRPALEEKRHCTCPPDERPTPCQHKYALNDCRAAAALSTPPAERAKS